MITEPQPHMIVLQLTEALYAQLQPYLEGLDITIAPHSHLADQESSAQSHVACYASVEQGTQQLTMRGEVYDALTLRVGGALDYDARWLPNEYESEGFVEHLRPLELIGSSHAQEGCPTCGAQIRANRTEVVCACGQAVSLI